MKKTRKERKDRIPIADYKTEDKGDKWYKIAKYTEIALRAIIAFILGILISRLQKVV